MPHRPHLNLRHLSSSLVTKAGFKSSPSPSPTPGIAWVVLGASHYPAKQDELNQFVSDLLAPDLLNQAGITLLWRLCNTNPSAASGTAQTQFHPINGGCCALAIAIHDIHSPEALRAFRSLPLNIEPSLLAHPSHPDDPDAVRHDSGLNQPYGADLKRYALIQRFQGRNPTHAHGSCIVAVAIEPADDAGDLLLDSWYRDEHLALLAQNPIFIRCTRFKLLSPRGSSSNSASQEPGRGAPKFLALHEYTSHQGLLEHAIEKGSLAPETARSRMIFSSAKAVERTIWTVSEVYDRSEWIRCGAGAG